MFLIVVYDVNVKRVNRVRQLFAQYLHWVQNSVFEGSLRESQYRELLLKAKELIRKDEDSILFYVLSDEGAVRERKTIGTPKGGMGEPFL